MNLIIKYISLLVLSLAAAVQGQVQDQPEYIIYRTGTPIAVDGLLNEPAWSSAPDVGRFVFPWHESGKMEQTVAKLLWDDTHLYVSFICEDAHIWAEHTQRRSRVWLDDAVEVFTSPDPGKPDAYFNIEMNVLGIFLDGFRPGDREIGNKDEWRAEGIQIKTTIVGTLNNDSDKDEYWILEAAIPFTNFAHVAKNTPPQTGDVWNLNMNRLGGNTNQQYSQWSASQTPRPSFHVPKDFGKVIFSNKFSLFWR